MILHAKITKAPYICGVFVSISVFLVFVVFAESLVALCRDVNDFTKTRYVQLRASIT